MKIKSLVCRVYNMGFFCTGRDGCAIQNTGRSVEGERKAGTDDSRSGKRKGT